MQTIFYILPELFLSISIMALLMLGVFINKSFKLINLLTILTLVLTIILTLNLPNEIVKIFNDSYIIDSFAIFMKILTLSFCVLVLISSNEYIKIIPKGKMLVPRRVSMQEILLCQENSNFNGPKNLIKQNNSNLNQNY
mgnify:CR=1 FL=1